MSGLVLVNLVAHAIETQVQLQSIDVARKPTNLSAYVSFAMAERICSPIFLPSFVQVFI